MTKEKKKIGIATAKRQDNRNKKDASAKDSRFIRSLYFIRTLYAPA